MTLLTVGDLFLILIEEIKDCNKILIFCKLLSIIIFLALSTHYISQQAFAQSKTVIFKPEITKYSTYNDFNISLQYPSNWNVTTNSDPIYNVTVISFISPNHANLNVVIEKLGQKNISLKSYVQTAIDELRSINSTAVCNITNSSANLSGSPAERLIYIIKPNTCDTPDIYRIVLLQFLTLKGNMAYDITFSPGYSWGDNSPDYSSALRMISSFKIESISMIPEFPISAMSTIAAATLLLILIRKIKFI